MQGTMTGARMTDTETEIGRGETIIGPGHERSGLGTEKGAGDGKRIPVEDTSGSGANVRCQGSTTGRDSERKRDGMGVTDHGKWNRNGNGSLGRPSPHRSASVRGLAMLQ